MRKTWTQSNGKWSSREFCEKSWSAKWREFLIDTDSSSDVLFLNVYDELGLGWSILKMWPKPLINFTGHSGKLKKKMNLEQLWWSNSLSWIGRQCNIILGRPSLNAMRAIVSTWHQGIKFLAKEGVSCTRIDTEIAKKCYTLFTKVKRCEKSLAIDTLNVKAQDHLQQGYPVEV